MERRPLVVGNWKMNGSFELARELSRDVAIGADRLSGVDVALCPPAVFLSLVNEAIAGHAAVLGAQTVSEHAAGAFTGEIAAPMLAEIGCRYVIVGHSERRHLFGESSATVAAKARAAIAADLTPIICLGEQLEDRNSGRTKEVIAEQLAPLDEQLYAQSVVAYEPVWAIGTGETATPDQAQDAHEFIRLSAAGAGATLRILYGGSVKPDNAAELFAMADIDGGLIGGASLKANDFLNICAAAG